MILGNTLKSTGMVDDVIECLHECGKTNHCHAFQLKLYDFRTTSNIALYTIPTAALMVVSCAFWLKRASPFFLTIFFLNKIQMFSFKVDTLNQRVFNIESYSVFADKG